MLFQGTVAAGQWIKKVVDGVLHDGDKNSRLDEVMYQVSFGEVAGDAAFSTLHRILGLLLPFSVKPRPALAVSNFWGMYTPSSRLALIISHP